MNIVRHDTSMIGTLILLVEITHIGGEIELEWQPAGILRHKYPQKVIQYCKTLYKTENEQYNELIREFPELSAVLIENIITASQVTPSTGRAVKEADGKACAEQTNIKALT